MLLGTGMACSVLPPTILATSRLAGDEAGAAAAVLNSLQSVGGSVGLATLVMVASQAGGPGSGPGAGMSSGFLTGSGFAALALLAAALLRGRTTKSAGAGPADWS